MARTDPDVQALPLPALKIPPLPVWLTVHREVDNSIDARFSFNPEGKSGMSWGAAAQ